MGADDLGIALQQFGLGKLISSPVEVAEAWSNEVYRVHTESGVFAVKLFPALSASRRHVLADAINFEQQASVVGIALPTPVLSVRGRVLADFDSATGPRTARCHHWVDGTPASRVTEDVEVAAEAGRVLGQLHAMRIDGGDTSQLADPELERWNRAVEASATAHLPWAETMAAIVPTIMDLANRIELLRQERRPMRTSHRDFDPKNAVVERSGRLFITDWDYAGPVIPGVELVTAAASFARSAEQLRRFATSYREAGGDAEPADPTALSIELADLDWVLRNVEAVLDECLGPSTGQFRTAADLISSFDADAAELESWAQGLRSVLQV